MSYVKPSVAAEYQRNRRDAARSRGDCIQCCMRPALPFETRCRECVAVRRAGAKRVYGPKAPRRLQTGYLREKAERKADKAAKRRLIRIAVESAVVLELAAKRLRTTPEALLESLLTPAALLGVRL